MNLIIDWLFITNNDVKRALEARRYTFHGYKLSCRHEVVLRDLAIFA